MFTTDFHTTAVTHRVGKWIDRLNEIAPRHDWGNYGFALEMRPAAKYLRVVMTTSTGSKSVHAFVDSDGHVFKAAGWKAPAKGVRYDLANDESFEAILSDADWSGGYLYKGGQSFVV